MRSAREVIAFRLCVESVERHRHASRRLARETLAWRPDVVLAWGERGPGSLWADRADGLAYVCHGHVCERPTDDPAELAERLDPGPAAR